jgi:hypothetical protein
MLPIFTTSQFLVSSTANSTVDGSLFTGDPEGEDDNPDEEEEGEFNTPKFASASESKIGK